MSVTEEWDNMVAGWEAGQAVMKEKVRALGNRIGFGNMMSLARDCWREDLEVNGYPVGGEFAVGPCVAMTVPCGCKSGMCDWCCGSGWLSVRCKQAKEKARR